VAIVATLSPRPAVDLRGPDSRRFANGMFTNNVRDLPVGASQRSAMTDDRGRVLALMELHALADDHFRVVLEGISADEFVERYERYVVFDDVELEPLGNVTVQTVQGPGADQVLRGHELPVPGDAQHVVVEGGMVVWSDRGGPGYDLVGLEALPETPEASTEAERLRIGAARARFPVDFAAPTLPHEHGLRDAALHFEKGCYLGQESIHRIDVMGKPRRALTVVHLEAPAAPGPVSFEGRAVGKITSVVPLAEGGALALAVLKKPADEPGATVDVGGVVGRAVPPRR